MNLLDWTGPEFLAFMALAIAASFGVAMLIGRWGRNIQDADPSAPLDAFETAFLKGGSEHAMAAANAQLQQDGVFTPGSPNEAEKVLPLESSPHLLVQEAHRQVTGTPNPTTMHKAMKPIRARLVELGLLVSDRRRIQIIALRAVLFGSVLFLGALKIRVGIERERPILFLLAMVILGGLAMLGYTLAADPFRTRGGESRLAVLRGKFSALKDTARTNPSALTGSEAAVALGLYGPPGVVGTGFDWLQINQFEANKTRTDSSQNCGGDTTGGDIAAADGGGGGDGCGGGCGGCGD